jgi:hypothetical protein
MRTIVNLPLVMLICFLAACTQQSESELYETAMQMDDPADRIELLETYLEKFPQGEKNDNVIYQLYANYSRLGRREAVSYAYKYLSLYHPKSRMRAYNSVAWTLAENEIGLDSALAYAERAVQMARSSKSRLTQMILDTYAFTLYKNGKIDQAVTAQKEAIIGHENDPEYLGRLSTYQFESGARSKGIENLVKTLLFSGQVDRYDELKTWLGEISTDESEQKNIIKQLVKRQLNDFLQEENSIIRQSKAAVLLAHTGVDRDKALQWAQNAVVSAVQNIYTDQNSVLISNLAHVHGARGEFSEMLDELQKIKNYMPTYNTDYWFALGQAYEKTDYTKDALNAYVSGMLWRKSDKLVKAATALLASGENLDDHIAVAKEAALNFNPGEYAESTTTNHVVLTELFTGAECGPCVGADLGLDRIAEYYPRTKLVLLEYHLHIPGPDPMTNTATEQRYKFYGANFGTPTVFINGIEKLRGGGPDVVQRSKFYQYRDAINNHLNNPADLSINMDFERTGEKIDINVTIEPRTQKKIRAQIFIALAEEHVEYSGSNGINPHAYVVRHVVENADEKAVTITNGTGAIFEQINLSDVEAKITAYLDNFITNTPPRFGKFSKWKARPEKLKRDNLALVAWAQDIDSKQVLQAIYKTL